MDMKNFALGLIERNPAIGNSPQARDMVEAIRTNDSAKGEQIAQNLCETYGVSREQAVFQARRFFGM